MPFPHRAAAAAPSSANEGASWLGLAARAGYAACGIIYLAIGAIAAGVTVGWAKSPGDAHRAMQLMERLPLGDLIVIALSIGLFGYAALNITGAVRDREQRRGFGGGLMRAADALTGALYLALAMVAVRIVSAPTRQGGLVIERWAADMMLVPGGPALLGAIGLSLGAAGAFLMYRARVESFEDILDRRTLSRDAWRFLAFSARFGTIARGVVLGIVGVLAIEAAVTRQAHRVGDVGDALSAIETTPAGRVVLAIVALGFMAYGAYQLAKVRHRRVPIH